VRVWPMKLTGWRKGANMMWLEAQKISVQPAEPMSVIHNGFS
jgi:hypothetical protein